MNGGMKGVVLLSMLVVAICAPLLSMADQETSISSVSRVEDSLRCDKPIVKRRPIVYPPPVFKGEPIEQNISDTQNLIVNCAPAVEIPSDEKKDSLPDWLEFFRHLVEAIAWPIVATAIAWRLGPELKRKLPLLRRFEAGPVKAEFDEELAAVRKEVDEQFPPAKVDAALSPDEARLLELAKISPRAAIAEAWRAVEVVANKAVERRFDQLPSQATSTHTGRPKSPISLARDLANLQLLTSQQLSVFHELRGLRNQASHAEEFEMDFQAANNYIQSSLALKLAIQSQ